MTHDTAAPAPGALPAAGDEAPGPRTPAGAGVAMVLDDLQRDLSKRPETGSVALRDILAALEGQSFPMLILLFALLMVSPLSVIPGATTLFGLIIAATVAQLLLGRDRLWLPAVVLDRPLPVQRTGAALRGLHRPLGWLERRLRRRQRWVFVTPFAQAPMMLVMLAALCAPLMEVIPASGTSVGAAISLFAAGLLARDGLLVLAGAGLAAALPITLAVVLV